MSLKVPASVNKAYLAAKKARAGAYAPYSKFQVGAALVTTDGEIITGCNIENASFGATVCAERVAILKAISSGEKKFSEIVVVTGGKTPAYPCALCLQMMAEFFQPKTKVWVGDLKEIRELRTFEELLPFRFGPKEFSL